MVGKIIMIAVSFGCGSLFYFIGAYAGKKEKPMHFWSGSEVRAEEITDVAQYNRENSILWKTYSLWYFAAGIAEFFDPIAALIFLVLGGTVGIALLVAAYNRIYKKYRAV